MSVRACRTHLRRVMGQQFEDLISAMVAKAKDGSYNHAMLLLEMDGIRVTAKEAAELRQRRKGKRAVSLEVLLLRAVERAEAAKSLEGKERQDAVDA